jgi:hypothetical protein
MMVDENVSPFVIKEFLEIYPNKIDLFDGVFARLIPTPQDSILRYVALEFEYDDSFGKKRYFSLPLFLDQDLHASDGVEIFLPKNICVDFDYQYWRAQDIDSPNMVSELRELVRRNLAKQGISGPGILDELTDLTDQLLVKITKVLSHAELLMPMFQATTEYDLFEQKTFVPYNPLQDRNSDHDCLGYDEIYETEGVKIVRFPDVVKAEFFDYNRRSSQSKQTLLFQSYRDCQEELRWNFLGVQLDNEKELLFSVPESYSDIFVISDVTTDFYVRGRLEYRGDHEGYHKILRETVQNTHPPSQAYEVTRKAGAMLAGSNPFADEEPEPNVTVIEFLHNDYQPFMEFVNSLARHYDNQLLQDRVICVSRQLERSGDRIEVRMKEIQGLHNHLEGLRKDITDISHQYQQQQQLAFSFSPGR